MAVQLDISMLSPLQFGRTRHQPAHGLAALTFLALLALVMIPGARADTATGVQELKRHNYISAIIELEDPARAGDPIAQVNLAAIYHYGLGVPADFALAMKWYRAAALQGNVDGQIGLAVIYAAGQGVSPNLPIARMWLSVAAAAMPPGPDRQRVERDRDGMTRSMTNSQVKESDDLIRVWYNQHMAP
jgi:TPR repeat protein